LKKIEKFMHFQGDYEETKNLLTKMSRYAGRRVPHPNELQWKTLLHDMLDLCTGVLKSMQPKLVYEVSKTKSSMPYESSCQSEAVYKTEQHLSSVQFLLRPVPQVIEWVALDSVGFLLHCNKKMVIKETKFF
jgi:hypothetical protein